MIHIFLRFGVYAVYTGRLMLVSCLGLQAWGHAIFTVDANDILLNLKAHSVSTGRVDVVPYLLEFWGTYRCLTRSMHVIDIVLILGHIA